MLTPKISRAVETGFFITVQPDNSKTEYLFGGTMDSAESSGLVRNASLTIPKSEKPAIIRTITTKFHWN